MARQHKTRDAVEATANVAPEVADAAGGATQQDVDAARPERSPLPATRPELLAVHAEWRRRRQQAPLGSPEYIRACDEIARIEVEIARLERAMDPPQV